SYHLETVVLRNHDSDLQSLLERGDKLRRIHQVAAIAYQDENSSVRSRQLDAQSGWYLVAHARVAELEVRPFAIACVPQLVEILDRAAGGRDDSVTVAGVLVELADQLRVGEPPVITRARAMVVELLRPLSLRGSDGL